MEASIVKDKKRGSVYTDKKRMAVETHTITFHTKRSVIANKPFPNYFKSDKLLKMVNFKLSNEM